jgi:hypothetical protein
VGEAKVDTAVAGGGVEVTGGGEGGSGVGSVGVGEVVGEVKAQDKGEGTTELAVARAGAQTLRIGE